MTGMISSLRRWPRAPASPWSQKRRPTSSRRTRRFQCGAQCQSDRLRLRKLWARIKVWRYQHEDAFCPLERRGEGDRDALRRSREVVREGGLVCVHIEGTRQRLGYPGERLAPSGSEKLQ